MKEMSLKTHDIQIESKRIVYSVYTYLKRLCHNANVTNDFFRCAQEVTAKACGLSPRTVSRMCSEVEKSVAVDADAEHVDVRFQSKQIVYGVYVYMKRLSRNADVTHMFFVRAQDLTAKACGVSPRTVSRICSEARKSVTTPDAAGPIAFASPRRTYVRPKVVSELNDIDAGAVRKTVSEFYDRGECPTTRTLLDAVRRRIDYTGSVGSLRRLLKNLGFSYVKCADGRKMLVERNDIVAGRRAFLRRMCALRRNNDDRRPVVYLGETWINSQQHVRSRSCNSRAADAKRRSSCAGKGGGGLVVAHAGCAREGLIEGAKLVIVRDSASDRRQNNRLNAEELNRWFDQLLSRFQKPSVFIVDNNVTVDDDAPDNGWKKEDVRKWLTVKNVTFSPSETLAELRLKANALVRSEARNDIHRIATQMGHEVIIIPPKHGQYNPMKFVWDRVEEQLVSIADNTLETVERSTNTFLDAMTLEDFEYCVRLAEQLQEEDYEKESIDTTVPAIECGDKDEREGSKA